MVLNDFGKIAYNEWLQLPELFPNIELDVFQIMPNHMHGIILINELEASNALCETGDGVVVAGLAPALLTAANNLDDTCDADKNSRNNLTANRSESRASPALTGTSQKTAANDKKFPNDSTTNRTAILGAMVAAYKSLVANKCLDICKITNQTMGKLWQRNYYDHIITNDLSCHNISDYIINNPANWSIDKFFRD